MIFKGQFLHLTLLKKTRTLITFNKNKKGTTYRHPTLEELYTPIVKACLWCYSCIITSDGKIPTVCGFEQWLAVQHCG